MKRRLLIATIFLLAGAVVNVAVAWGTALIVNPYHFPLPNEVHALRKSTVFKIGEITAFGTVSYSCRRDWTSQRGRDLPMIHDVLPRWASRHQLYTATLNTIHGSGWPLPVFSASIHPMRFGTGDYEVLGGTETPFEPFTYGGIRARTGRNLPPGVSVPAIAGPRVLPLNPIWTGLFANTALYAVVLAVLWLAVRTGYQFVFRYLTRARRGLCPHCAYPMGDSEVCTECGKPLPKRARVAT